MFILLLVYLFLLTCKKITQRSYRLRLIMKAQLFLFAFFVSVFCNFTQAQIKSITSGNWDAASTWSCNCVPTKNDNVIIKTGHTVKTANGYLCRNLEVEKGASIEILGTFLAEASAPISPNLYLGQPTKPNDTTDLLMVKPQFVLSYNNTKRHANWVSWELSTSWLGTSDRQNDFRPDSTLKQGWYRVVTSDYTNSGFDRGHLCPSADRTKSEEDNSATFLMTNIAPQAPVLNREPWAYLEEYCRNVVKTGYKAVIIAGMDGSGGAGTNGSMQRINGKINVPSKLYKIVVFYPEQGSITTNSTVIAANFPNTNEANQDVSWLKYVTTIKDIESSVAGVDFLSSLPMPLQTVLKNKKFDVANAGFDVEATVRTYNGRPLLVGPRGGCYYINSNGNKTYVDRFFCGN